jgi:hypothetical protein
LVDEAHVHQAPAQQWFTQMEGGFATCPITHGILLRLLMRLGACNIEQALAVPAAVATHPLHRFWLDALAHGQIRWHGVVGHRQITNAYLAGLARHHKAKLSSFDSGLVAPHPDVGVALTA